MQFRMLSQGMVLPVAKMSSNTVNLVKMVLADTSRDPSSR